jgi:Hydrazine synthase alpha subunit middle domain
VCSRAAIILFCAVVFMALALHSRVHGASSAEIPLLYTAASEYAPLAWLHGGERFPQGAAIYIRDGERRRRLVAGFSGSADANVSFDGKTILFAGKQHARDRWQIWEIAAHSGTLRQVTRCNDDCVTPFYVPPDRFVYARKIAGKFVLEIASLSPGGGKPLQLTHAPGNSLPVDVLRDGRVLFEASYPLGEGATPELYTVYPDGSGVESYRCDHGRARYAGKQISSGDIVLIREDGLGRFTSALAHDVAVPAPTGIYAGDITETASGEWLVSWRSAADKKFELRKWKPGEAFLQPGIAEPGANILEPVLLSQRPAPKRFPSGLHEWSYANTLCLNAYTSKTHFAEGSIASVRFYTPGPSGSPQLLGTAPVEKDGSFYVRVPGDRPLKIELLDQSGKTLKREAGWYWMRGGEQRICVGCHAGPETAPENVVPEVLLHTIVPVDLSATKALSQGGH